MKEDRVYLLHIRDAIERIESYTKGGREAFFREPIVQDAVIRNLEIIGEAVKNLSEKYRLEHSELPWPRIAGMRDVLIHDYFGIRLETVWEVIEKRIPALKGHILSVLQ